MCELWGPIWSIFIPKISVQHTGININRSYLQRKRKKDNVRHMQLSICTQLFISTATKTQITNFQRIKMTAFKPRLSNQTNLKPTVEHILLTYLRTFLTYRILPFADKLWTLEKNKGHFVILELNFGIIKWPYFLPKVSSL